MTPLTVSIGDMVEVYCDHKRNGRRIRDWVEGVVVHADDRMTAIQFRNDVYLTDGWMVPDRILWFNKGSAKIRLARKVRGGPAAAKPKSAFRPHRRKGVPKKRKVASAKRHPVRARK
jgi:hypothetical protein